MDTKLGTIFDRFMQGDLERDNDEKGADGVWDYTLEYFNGDVEKAEHYYNHLWKLFEYLKENVEVKHG